MKVCVVLPTYNEAGTIGEVIARVLASTPDVDILVADDNSPDATGGLADDIAAREQHVRVLHRPGKAGLGPAYVAGFKVVEIPIVFTERREGVSKMSRAIVAEALKNIAVWGTKRARPSGRPHPRSVAAQNR